MKYISILSFFFFLISCTSTKQHQHIIWESIVKDDVKTIYQGRHTVNQDSLTYLEINTSEPLDIFLELSDSTIAFFNKEKLLTSNKTYCKEELRKGNSFSPCSERLIEYDKKNRLKSSEYQDLLSDYTTYNKVKEYNDQELPLLIEMVDEKGNIIGLNRYEFDENSLVIKRIMEFKNPDLKTTIINEYNKEGLVIKVTSTYDNRQADEQYQPLPTENTASTTYEYLEFDKHGNWTKRKEINNKLIVSYSYRTYEYYK